MFYVFIARDPQRGARDGMILDRMDFFKYGSVDRYPDLWIFVGI